MEDKNRKRNSWIGTVVFHSVLLLLFLFVGLKYQDPPIEDGIAINFGYEDDGQGNTEQAPQQSTPQQPEEVVETPDVPEEVATQEAVEAPAISEKKPEPKPKEKPKEVKEPDPQPTSDLSDRLSRVRNTKGSGEGETQGGGDQGSQDGDPNSKNRTGTGGLGDSGDYRLGGRKALQRPKPNYNCPEEGRVVVKIYVDRYGKVVNAVPGERIPGDVASNTSSKCLFDRARDAAMSTTWQGDPNAPEQQVGYIIYNFSKK